MWNIEKFPGLKQQICILMLHVTCQNKKHAGGLVFSSLDNNNTKLFGTTSKYAFCGGPYGSVMTYG